MNVLPMNLHDHGGRSLHGRRESSTTVERFLSFFLSFGFFRIINILQAFYYEFFLFFFIEYHNDLFDKIKILEKIHFTLMKYSHICVLAPNI